MPQLVPADAVTQKVIDGHRYRRLTMAEVAWLKDITTTFELPGFYGIQLQIVELEDGNLWIRDNELH